MQPVLPAAPALTADGARRLVGQGLPRWVTPVLLTGWLAAITVALITDPGVCDPRDPSVCAPDHVFAWAFVVAVATPILLLWMPLLGCLAGVLFAIADLLFDPIEAAHPGFALHGSACAVAVFLHLRARAGQRAVLADLTRDEHAAPLGLAGEPAGLHPAVVTLSAVLVLVAVGSLAWERHVIAQERQHLDRAVVTRAEVIDVEPDDYQLHLAVGEGLDDRKRVRVEVLDTDPYPVGSQVDVRLDPRDPSWVRLVAEPQDPTGWENLTYACLLLAALLIGRQVRRRRALARLVVGQHPAFQVVLGPDPTGNLLLRSRDGATLGRYYPSLLAEPEPESHEDEDEHEFDWELEVEEFGRLWRGEVTESELAQPEEPVAFAVLQGDVRDRGWCLLITDERVIMPAAPVRIGIREGSRREALKRQLPTGLHRLVPEPPADPEHWEGVPGVPVVTRLAGLSLPLSAAPQLSRRVRAGLEGLAIGLVAPVFIGLFAESWFQRIMATVLGASLLGSRLAPAFQRVTLTRESLLLRTGGSISVLPWERVLGVRREGSRLYVALDPDDVVGLGPLVVERGELAGEQGAEHVGAAMMTQRERALAAGSPGRDERQQRGPMWTVMTIYVMACAVAMWVAA